MLDIRFIKKNIEYVKRTVKLKWYSIDIDNIISLNEERIVLDQNAQDLRRRKNEISSSRDSTLIDEWKNIKNKLSVLDKQIKEISDTVYNLLLQVPNIPTKDTPEWISENDNVVLRTWWEIPIFNFGAKWHDELWINLWLIDLERATKVVAPRFSYLKWDLVLMQFWLMQYVMEILTNEELLKKIIEKNNLNISSKPFIPVVPPIFINPDAFLKMARMEPKDERYYIPSDNLFLIWSAEHTLWAMHMNEVFNEKDLPIRYIWYSTSLRREAWASWKDTKWIIRQHQFDKLEMESFSLPENSIDEQNFLVAIQEYLMQSLNIPYQVIMCCTWDMWWPDARHLDIEAWMPWQWKYRETHSADLMTDYQSRRLNIKVKREDWKKELVHMNDATAFAIWRTLIAIMENYQQKNWKIKVPDILKKYLNKDFIW